MTAAIYPTPARAWLEVDLDAVRYNAERLAAHAGVPLIAMVKADAYGCGAIEVARALGAAWDGDASHDASSTLWALGIATLDEAESLRAAGCRARIVCFPPLQPSELARAQALGVRPSLHRAADIAAWGRREVPWHLSIDTGMSRAGIRWDLAHTLRDAVAANPPEGVYTHWHSADEHPDTRREQEARFAMALGTLGDALPPECLRHMDNSAGICTREGEFMASRGTRPTVARPGVALYGGMFVESLELAPVVHLRARVVDLRDVHVGETVSYGATWQATGTRRIATVPVGYADGYRRHLSNRARVLLQGVLCPLVGRVTMDMVMVDVTDLPVTCELGDVATLIGRDGDTLLTVGEVAGYGALSPYELLVGLRLRVPRVFVSPSTRS